MAYLEDIYHDNNYVTAYFHRIDERREKRVRTILIITTTTIII